MDFEKIELHELDNLDYMPIVEIHYKPTRLSKKPLDNTEKQVEALKLIYNKKDFDSREQAVILMLDAELYPIGVCHISTGDNEKVTPDVKYILQVLLKHGCHKFIFSHSHPMASEQPSEEDFHFTFALDGKARFYEIELFDHIILNHDGFFSFADNDII